MFRIVAALLVLALLVFWFPGALEDQFREEPWATVLVSGMLLVLASVTLLVVKPAQIWGFAFPAPIRIVLQMIAFGAGAALIAWSFKL